MSDTQPLKAYTVFVKYTVMATKETNAKGLANAIATLENLRDLNADYTILSVNEGRINK